MATVAAVVGAVGTVAGAVSSMSGSDSAGGAVMQGNDEQIKLMRPFYEAGASVLPIHTELFKKLSTLYPVLEQIALDTDNTSKLTQLRLNEGAKALNHQLAARGFGGKTGAAVTAHSDMINQILAEEEQNKWSRLMQLAGLTQSNSPAQLGAQAAGVAANNTMQAYGGLANANMAGARSMGNMFGTLGAIPTQMWGMNQMQKMFNTGWGSPTGGGGGAIPVPEMSYMG